MNSFKLFFDLITDAPAQHDVHFRTVDSLIDGKGLLIATTRKHRVDTLFDKGSWRSLHKARKRLIRELISRQ